MGREHEIANKNLCFGNKEANNSPPKMAPCGIPGPAIAPLWSFQAEAAAFSRENCVIYTTSSEAEALTMG